MTLTEIKDAINGLSAAQIKIFNQICSSKLYDESSPVIDPTPQEYAEDLAAEVNELSTGDLGDLNGTLNASRKLSQRPC